MFIKKMNKAVILLALLSISAFAQGTFTDSRDGKKYKSVKIGEQTWMAQNLDYQGEDGNLGKCYDDKPENCTKYGRLYDWATAMNIDAKFNYEVWRNTDTSNVKHSDICPEGWHLPSREEWSTLRDFAGGEKVAGKKLKAKNGWNKYENKNGNGTDNYGFSGLPGGSGNSNGSFRDIGSYGLWGTGSGGSNRTPALSMVSGLDNLSNLDYGKSGLISVRCLKD